MIDELKHDIINPWMLREAIAQLVEQQRGDGLTVDRASIGDIGILIFTQEHVDGATKEHGLSFSYKDPCEYVGMERAASIYAAGMAGTTGATGGIR